MSLMTNRLDMSMRAFAHIESSTNICNVFNILLSHSHTLSFHSNESGRLLAFAHVSKASHFRFL